VVRVGEEVFPDDGMHPPRALLTERVVTWELPEHFAKVTISHVPDLTAKLLECLVPGLFIHGVAFEELRVAVLEVLSIQTGKISDTRPVVWV
jgi:hypothetical protein